MSSILTFSITCISGSYLAEDYRFELALPADSTLDVLEGSILDVLEFDGDHLSYFYVANTPHGKQVWSTYLGEEEGDADLSTIRLCDLYPLERNKKLFYRYDLGAGWGFEIVKKGREAEALDGQAYPLLVLEEGVKPLENGGDDDGFW